MESTFAPIWNQIADGVRPHLNEATFKRWFSGIQLVSASDEELILAVPNHIYQIWIETNYMAVLRAAVIDVLGASPVIKFAFHEAVDAKPASEAKPEVKEKRTPVAAQARLAAEPEEADFLPVDETAALANGMNPRNSFDNFVVGSNNQFAHAASVAVAKSPGRTYNPLFVYGGSGLGKTHLMHAVGQQIGRRVKGAKVIYLTSEKFTNEFISAIQNSTLPKFRSRYRKADVLLIDDIQFLAGKERSQEEFFHTFNALFDGHKQIVLSSDRPASEISNLEDRLVTRFDWGLTAELQVPDIETRLAILQKKAETMNVTIDPEVLNFLATRIRSNVRLLEGALVRVASLSSLGDTMLSPASVEHVLKDILQKEARRAVTIDQIQRRVAEHFDIRIADMTSKRRPANIAFPRQVAMYLARELTKSSLSEIGEAFGGRDHGTVMHAHKLVGSKIQEQEQLRQTVSLLDSQLTR